MPKNLKKITQLKTNKELHSDKNLLWHHSITNYTKKITIVDNDNDAIIKKTLPIPNSVSYFYCNCPVYFSRNSIGQYDEYINYKIMFPNSIKYFKYSANHKVSNKKIVKFFKTCILPIKKIIKLYEINIISLSIDKIITNNIFIHTLPIEGKIKNFIFF